MEKCEYSFEKKHGKRKQNVPENIGKLRKKNVKLWDRCGNCAEKSAENMSTEWGKNCDIKSEMYGKDKKKLT